MTALTIIVLVTTALPVAAQTPSAVLLAESDQSLSKGEYPAAIEKATEAARLFALEKSPDKQGAALNIAGAAYLHQGDYLAALPRLEQAVELARQTKDTPAEVRRLNNIGNVYFYLGRYGAAFATYQLAENRLKGSESEPWHARHRQLTLTNIAVLHQQLGQHQKALDIYKEIRSLPLKLAPSVEAQVLTNLAIVYRRLGDPHKALETYQAAQNLLAKDPNAAASLYTLHNIGVVQALDFHDLPRALVTFEKALQIALQGGSKRQIVLERLFLGETLFLMQRTTDALGQFQQALEAAQVLNLTDERWTALYGLGRCHAVRGDSAAALGSFRAAIAVIESERSKLSVASLKAEFLAGKRDVYDAVIEILLRQSPAPAAELLRRMEEGRARNLKELQPGEGKTVSLESIQAQLDPETILLEYWTRPGQMAVLWVTRGQSGVVHRTVSAAEFAQIDQLTLALAKRGSKEWENLAGPVSRIVLGDVLPVRTGIRRLIVVPDGRLHFLPFEVLSHGDGKRVVENFEVHYLPAASFLVTRQAQSHARRWPWQTRLISFADPLVPEGASQFDGGWPRLTHSEEEARTIAAVLPGRSQLHTGAGNLKSVMFTPAVEQARVLHFATHAAIDSYDSRRSRMIFTPTAGEPASQYLFGSEIAKLALSHVELVTLAACETERGRFVPGEGVENFSRAFLGAGAASAVGSLWRVSDQATARFMRTFYSNLAHGATKAAALRTAKLEFLHSGNETAHPYFWAAFLLSGDGESPLSPVISWMWFGLPVAVLLLLDALRRIRRGSRS